MWQAKWERNRAKIAQIFWVRNKGSLVLVICTVSSLKIPSFRSVIAGSVKKAVHYVIIIHAFLTTTAVPSLNEKRGACGQASKVLTLKNRKKRMLFKPESFWSTIMLLTCCQGPIDHAFAEEPSATVLLRDGSTISKFSDSSYHHENRINQLYKLFQWPGEEFAARVVLF